VGMTQTNAAGLAQVEPRPFASARATEWLSDGELDLAVVWR
jgi:hypothetical protein